LQGIGWALLAACDDLADLTDASADNGGQLAEIASCVDDLAREPLGSRVLGAFGHLARRAGLGSARQADAAGPRGGVVAGISGPGKSGIVTRYAEQWFRDHPGGMAEVRDLKVGLWDAHGGQGVLVDAPQGAAGLAGLDAAGAGIVRRALADAVAWRAWKAGVDCGECDRLDPGRCAEHAADEDLAAAYEALRDCLPGGDGQ
jgi:hypothetical protein